MNPIESSMPLSATMPANLEVDVNGLGKTIGKGIGKGIGDQRIDDVASEFESVFVSLLLKEMRNTLDPKEGGLFGSEGSDTFGGMFDMFMGQHLAEAQPLGIAGAIRGYLSNLPPDLEFNLNLPTDPNSESNSELEPENSAKRTAAQASEISLQSAKPT